VKLLSKLRRTRAAPHSEELIAPDDIDAVSSTNPSNPPPASEGIGPWQIVKAAASFITPVTLITGLMYYFGLLHAYWFFGGFGVDYTVFELTPEDYILRSADGLFLPFSVVAVAVLVFASISQIVVPRLRPDLVDNLIPAVTIVFLLLGFGLTGVACIAFLQPRWAVNFPSLGGLALAAGVLLLKGGTSAARELAHRRRTPARPLPTYWPIAEWAAVIMLVSVGLFWAVGDFSATVGSQRAEEVIRSLPQWPSIVVHSDQRLYLNYDGVNETVCEAGDGTIAYTYNGLVLITQEGGQLLLLPRSWTPSQGSAVVVSKTDSLILQFSLRDTDAPAC
jgi:hypothetical protein